jgi:hypothetical protein
VIKGIDTRAARAVPGVIGILDRPRHCPDINPEIGDHPLQW